jgi:hypothetical protein
LLIFDKVGKGTFIALQAALLFTATASIYFSFLSTVLLLAWLLGEGASYLNCWSAI